MRPMHASAPPAGVSPTFWHLCIDEPLAREWIIDIGTGSGRLALALAPLAKGVVGIDTDASAIAEAAGRAAARGIDNASFRVVDADHVDYRTLAPEAPALVTAHLFLSEPLVAQGARAVVPGGALIMLGFHVDQWQETGRVSRFAFDEARMAQLVEVHGLRLEHLSVEREVETFDSVDAALAAVRGHERPWQADGRWACYRRFLEHGGRTLTRSYLIVRARKPSSSP